MRDGREELMDTEGTIHLADICERLLDLRAADKVKVWDILFRHKKYKSKLCA